MVAAASSSQLSSTTPINQHSKMSKMILSLMMVAAASSSPLKVEQTKAASPYVNLGCQCSPLTFQDQYGAIQGNCKSVDSTGARWCYIDQTFGSSCQDKRFSARFPNNPWSYEACATPLPYAPLAPVSPPHVHAPASAPFTAPLQPVHSHPVHPVQPVHQHGYGANIGTFQPLGQFIPKKADQGAASQDA